MFGIDSGELLIIAVVALVVIGPKDLPRVMRALGNFIGRARGMARHFRSGIDAMIRESELEEMDKKWREQNERIMREHPLLGEPAAAKPVPSGGGEAVGDSDWGKPAADPPPASAAPPPRAVPAGSAPPIPPSGAAARPVPPAGAAPPPEELP